MRLPIAVALAPIKVSCGEEKKWKPSMIEFGRLPALLLV